MTDEGFLRFFNFSIEEGWAAVTLIEVYKDLNLKQELLGYVFVIDYGLDEPKWKCPSGHKKQGENPFGTAIREARGEAGVELDISRTEFFGSYRARNKEGDGFHWRCYFRSMLAQSEVPWIHSRDPENEGEKPKFFTTAEFGVLVTTGEFLAPHFLQARQLRMFPSELAFLSLPPPKVRLVAPEQAA